MKTRQHLYLSPHFDDTALSCGGLVHQQALAGETILSVTVFAASPGHTRYSAFAEAMHQVWGSPDDIVAARRAEDHAAMTALGAEAAYLDFSDCIYRGNPETGQWYYTSDPDIFGRIHPADLPLAGKIAAAIEALQVATDKTVFYAPLTVGHHIDHQLVHRAARDLLYKGCQVVFYEDYPYVDPNSLYQQQTDESNLYNLAFALAEPHNADLKPKQVELSEENLQAKIESIRAYASQMEMLFGGPAAMAKYVRAYALRVGQGRLAERIWEP